MKNSTSDPLDKARAAWEFVGEDIAELWINGTVLEEDAKERAVRLADDLEHFVMRLRELSH